MSGATLSLEPWGAAPWSASRERVDVWVVALATDPSQAALRTLSESEREFATRLRVGAAAWLAARAALRQLLGHYLGLAPARVALVTGTNGKPRLAPGASADLRFNLSHSGEIALVAVRLGLEVGVDVEKLRLGVDGAAIARDIFNAPERLGLETMAAGVTAGAFFRSWVRREALAKATGIGIVSPPTANDDARFTVRDLSGIPGYAAALASEGATWSVKLVGT